MTRADEPAWVEHALWWHVYPLGFAGADPTGGDRERGRGLRALIPWLDYVVELGASGLALGPVFASSTHGYDTLDHFRIDDRLGEDGDFDALVAAAHGRGLKVLLDGVFNHVGRDFTAPSADWLVSTGAGEAVTFEGHGGLLVLNHSTPAVVDLVVDVMNHWLGRGADGWRLDAAYAVPSPFWAQVLARVRQVHPDAYIVGEVIHGDYPSAVADGTLDSLTQYELWKAIWSSINDVNLFELAWSLTRHDGYLDSFVPFTFVGNHDVTRIASRLDDPRHLPHAHVLLFTVGGTPAVYYGDEQAFRGVKEERFGGDDAVRPAFPAAPSDLAPEGWATYRLHQELIGLRRRHPWLHRARVHEVHLANEQFVYDARVGDRSLRVLLNLGDTELRHEAPGELLAGEAGLDGGVAAVPPHGWAVLG